MSQIERQYSNPEYTGKRPLSFADLEEAQLEEARVAELDLLLESATIPDIQAQFAEDNLSSEELVKYYIQRIRTYDVDGYNTILELNPDALKIAREKDAQRKSGNTNSMQGIPVLLKDNIGTGDKMHNTAGSKSLEHSHCDRDAFLVQQLREAGAIILAKANLSQWANFMSFDSANGFSVLGGQTRNAYGKFDVGGSSAGSGSSVSLNFGTVTIGTETAGSLVSPATNNSACTLKPSLGLVSRDRIIPITDKQDTAGPLTRNMTDLAHFINAFKGVDSNDSQTEKAAPLADIDFTDYLDKDALKGKHLAVVVREKEVIEGDAAVLEQAMIILQDAGATIVKIPYLIHAFSFLTYFYGMHKGVNDYLEAIGSDLTLAKIVAFNKEDPKNRAPFGQDYLELCAKTAINTATEKAYQRLHHTNYANAAYAVRRALSDYQADAIVDLANYGTGAYAMSGLPAVCVPAGYRESGSPLGITFFADYLQDAELVALGYAFEQAAQVRKAPKLVLPSERGD
jgi:amidase